MAAPKPVPFHQVPAGEVAVFFALLSEKSRLTARDGRPYFACTFRDARRSAAAMIWADSPFFKLADGWQPGGFFRVVGGFGEHAKYGPQLDLRDLREVTDVDRADGFREQDFYDRSRFDSDPMFAELRTLAEAEIRDEPLRKLTLKLLDDNAVSLKLLPASDRRFFPFPGGWLEHVLNVTRNCLWLADRYIAHYSEMTPPLNRDLIAAGAVLHEIGRVGEMTPAGVPGQPPEPTVEGRLFGHLLLARDMVRAAAKDVPDLNPELLMLLEHIVLTHLTLPEWGSPRLPAIPEVLILHHADDLDAKMEMYFRRLTRDTSAGPFTDSDPVLKKPLLKKRSV